MSRWPRVAMLAFGLLLAACAPAPPTPTPAPALPFDYSQLARTTPAPVTPVPTITPGGATTVSFAGEIQPLLNAHCVRCHGGIAGLWLSSYEQAMLGSISGPAIRPGEPERSPLLTYVSQGLMPPDAPALPPAQVALLRRWIAEGAHPN